MSQRLAPIKADANQVLCMMCNEWRYSPAACARANCPYKRAHLRGVTMTENEPQTVVDEFDEELSLDACQVTETTASACQINPEGGCESCQ